MLPEQGGVGSCIPIRRSSAAILSILAAGRWGDRTQRRPGLRASVHQLSLRAQYDGCGTAVVGLTQAAAEAVLPVSEYARSSGTSMRHPAVIVVAGSYLARRGEAMGPVTSPVESSLCVVSC